MGLDGKSVLTENVVTGTHHASIVGVDVSDIDPRADTMVLERRIQVAGSFDVFVEEHDCL